MTYFIAENHRIKKKNKKKNSQQNFRLNTNCQVFDFEKSNRFDDNEKDLNVD
jgi:hypothetical protein